MHRVYVTIGGDLLEYVGATTTHFASLTTTKLMLNIPISTPNAKFMTIDINKILYDTHYDYTGLPLSLIPE